jgi:hypothetical protein
MRFVEQEARFRGRDRSILILFIFFTMYVINRDSGWQSKLVVRRGIYTEHAAALAPGVAPSREEFLDASGQSDP